MENTDFDWLNGNWASNFEFSSGSPRASTAGEASQTADRVDQLAQHTLPLLRLSGWEADKQYDKNNPVCIHYDYRWKISQREKIRARHVCSNTDLDIVLAPSDFWKTKFKAQLESLLQDENKFPGDNLKVEVAEMEPVERICAI